MTKSMTGYGSAKGTVEGLTISVELKSVNNRYLDPSVRLPRSFLFAEDAVKALRARGVNVECCITIEEKCAGAVDVQVNHPLAKAYISALNELADTYGIRNDITTASLTRFNDVFTVHKAEADEDAIWEAVEPTLAEATDHFVAMRETEGEKLKEDICSKADNILEMVEFIEKRSPETVREYNEKVKGRIRDLLGDAKVDEQRLLTEAAIYADKVAVDEETVRLHSHISQLKAMFDDEGPIGRKMDFLVQEINREANTIGSKASDLEITSRVLSIKGEVEKIREQVQNIE